MYYDVALITSQNHEFQPSLRIHWVEKLLERVSVDKIDIMAWFHGEYDDLDTRKVRRMSDRIEYLPTNWYEALLGIAGNTGIQTVLKVM